jgi:16S rRNA (cytidine1402-2'-O)-methyltransferase
MVTNDGGILYVVPTPIGNLEDITLRALRILREVEIVACEDTRVTGRLLQLLGIDRKRLISLHAHNESGRTAEIITILRDGAPVALVSDAGTPGISDPGSYLIAAVIEQQLPLTVLPGPSAAITALVGSGFSLKSFHFEGFLPTKKGRRTRLEQIRAIESVIVLYESPHRLKKTIAELQDTFGPERRISVARELTKIYEEFLRGSLDQIGHELNDRAVIKGECVIVIDAAPTERGGRKRDRMSEDDSSASDGLNYGDDD